VNDDDASPPARNPDVTAAGNPTDPVTAISWLQAALSDHGIISTPPRVVDQSTAMLIADEQIVLCRDQCFWWATGRFREGRPVTRFHAVADPAGAARRLAGLDKARAQAEKTK